MPIDRLAASFLRKTSKQPPIDLRGKIFPATADARALKYADNKSKSASIRNATHEHNYNEGDIS